MSKTAHRFPRAKRCVVALAACLLSALPVTAGAQQLAFPGATGYGRFAAGGRGGAVIRVTNLNDSGSGSLRACVEATGPRTCVFRVGGTITTSSPIEVNNPYITIAGQTAPGGGIVLRRTGTWEGSALGLFDTHNVIVRHIRAYPGNGSDTDAIDMGNVENVIIDHVTTLWGTDENMSMTDAYVRDITVQWTIMGEGLQPHSKGWLGCNGGGTVCERITSRNNLYALNNDRNPNIDVTNSFFDVWNDVIYGAGSEYVEIHDSAGGTNPIGSRVNIVNSYFKKATFGNSTCAIVYHPDTGPSVAQIYANGNALDQVPCLLDSDAQAVQVGAPVHSLPSNLTTAATAYTQVTQQAGAFPRDAAASRIVNHVLNRTGAIVSAPTGYPAITSGTPCTDTDADGICLAYETTLGTSDTNAADRNGDHDGDGYTNLEEFLDKKHNDVTPP